MPAKRHCIAAGYFETHIQRNFCAPERTEKHAPLSRKRLIFEKLRRELADAHSDFFFCFAKTNWPAI
jgi:hypothetical protein